MVALERSGKLYRQVGMVEVHTIRSLSHEVSRMLKPTCDSLRGPPMMSMVRVKAVRFLRLLGC